MRESNASISVSVFYSRETALMIMGNNMPDVSIQGWSLTIAMGGLDE